MRRTFAAIFIELLSGFIAARTAAPLPATAFAANSFVRRTCLELLRASRFGFDKAERAAFIVRSANGSLSEIEWPSTGLNNGERWFGAIPHNTIAIVHTHPCWIPRPSAVDATTARRSGIPVWVITRKHLYMTDGTREFDVAQEDWVAGA